MSKLKHFITDESGATAIEYALIAALISLVAIFAMRTLGNRVSQAFTQVATELDTATQAR